jgi:aminodeoxyfutalosine synthase
MLTFDGSLSRSPGVPFEPGASRRLMATALVEARLRDASLESIRDKVLAGERLSFEDGLALYRSHDLLGVGLLANHVREKKHGDAAYFVWNTHVNHTNVCVATCDFCAFAAKKDEPRAYTMRLEEIFSTVRALPKGVREVHIVGGLHPDLPWSYFTDMMKGIKAARPDIHVKGFTAVEIFFFHRLYRKSVAEVLGELKEAGLDSMPGGGAEIFAPETRDRIIRGKADADEWLGVMRTAHELGIPTNCTMLYGHVEPVEHRVDHLLRLRALQDETGGFVTYIPLAFQPWEAPGLRLPETTGFEDLKAIAVGRLLLDNIPHVKSYWVMIGPRLAQVGLSFGADDIDGTVTEEKIAHDAGASTAQALTVDELVRLIREAGRRPVERDTVFGVVREW